MGIEPWQKFMVKFAWKTHSSQYRHKNHDIVICDSHKIQVRLIVAELKYHPSTNSLP